MGYILHDAILTRQLRVEGKGDEGVKTFFGDSEDNGLCRLSTDPITGGQASFLFSRNLTAASTGSPVMLIKQDHASDTQGCLSLVNDGTGVGINIDNNGNGPSIRIDQDCNSAADKPALTILSDNAGTGAPIGIDISDMAAGEAVFKVVADANDPTTGGGAADGRIAVDVAGSIVYIAYYT